MLYKSKVTAEEVPVNFHKLQLDINHICGRETSILYHWKSLIFKHLSSKYGISLSLGT